MSERKWIKDMNYHLYKEGTHWKDAPDRPTNNAYVYEYTLSHNTLMNLFKDSVTGERTTFIEYYEMPIAEMLLRFNARLLKVPQNLSTTSDPERHTKVQLDQARLHLLEAAVAAEAPAVKPLRVKDLYLQCYYDNIIPLAPLRQHLMHFKGVLNICVPFLELPDTRPNPGDPDPRPTIADYERHVYGGGTYTYQYVIITKDDNGNDIRTCEDRTGTLIGLGRFDFEGMLFYNPELPVHPVSDGRSPQDRANNIYASRRFAAAKGFLMPVNTNCTPGIPIPQKGPVGIKNSGNGYKCYIENNARVCKVSDPSHYCVANGSTTCP